MYKALRVKRPDALLAGVAVSHLEMSECWHLTAAEHEALVRDVLLPLALLHAPEALASAGEEQAACAAREASAFGGSGRFRALGWLPLVMLHMPEAVASAGDTGRFCMV